MLCGVRAVLTALVLICAISLLPAAGMSADLFVNPVRLFYTPKQKTAITKVKNNSDQKVSLQINVYSWIQDEKAEDQYSPTQDIVLFPKILTLQGNEERIIRVGVKVPPGVKEKTYRIFLEELPQPFVAEGTILRTILKIGVPVFILPTKPEAAGEIEKIELSKGNLSFVVKNKGNVHFIIQTVKLKGVDASGASVFQTEATSRYLLEGRSRTFSFNFSKEDCLKMGTLTIDVTTDKISLSKRLDVIPQMCSP